MKPARYFPVSLPPAMPGPFFPIAPGSPGGERFVELDDERDAYLRAKRSVLAQAGRGPVRLVGARPASAIATTQRWLRERLQAEHPGLFESAQLEREDLDALAMRIQEDVVVLARALGVSAPRAPAVYLHVCLPSHWDPQRMLGKNFIGLHARVPYEDGFGKAERVELAGALFAHPAARFVWALTPDNTLDQHPARRPREGWATTHTGYLRVERQCVVPLRSDGAKAPDVCVFLIRPYRYAFGELDAAQRSTLRQAVSAMSTAMLRYKGIEGHTARVLELLA